MGARLVIKFDGGPDEEPARVYMHWGGEYQAEIRETLDAFLADVKQLDDSRIGDPSYLAAKLVVWAADRSRYPRDGALLEFLSVGVVTSDGWGDGVATVKSDGSYSIDAAVDLEVTA